MKRRAGDRSAVRPRPRELSAPIAKCRKTIRLTVDDDGHKRKLQQLIEQIENLKVNSFPASTSAGEATEYRFTAQALDRAGQSSNTVKISYFDYPGEELKKVVGVDEAPVHETLRNARFAKDPAATAAACHVLSGSGIRKYSERLRPHVVQLSGHGYG